MMPITNSGALGIALAMAAGVACVAPMPAVAQHAGAHGAGGRPVDTRLFVAIPEPMNGHMLANMRDHLVALQEIQQLLAAGKGDEAAATAEKRLGLSSLDAHGASHIAGFMPQGMQEAGTGMHRAASRFAIAARNFSVTGELRPAVQALSEVMQACNGCHAGYRTR